MSGMFGVELTCSDERCPFVLEAAVAELDDLERLVCDGCECTLQVLAVWEVEEARAAEPGVYELPLAA